MRPILVTGHLGLIGRAVCALLDEDGIEHVGFDSRAEEGEGRGDVRVKDWVLSAASRCGAIVHLAAQARVVAAERDGVATFRTNVDGTANVAAAAARLKIGLVHASSRVVYGSLTPNATRVFQRMQLDERGRRKVRIDDRPRGTRVSERMPLQACHAYGSSKVAAEAVVEHAKCTHSILRFSNVYGSANDYPDRVVPAFVRAALSGGELLVEGSDRRFDFVHVSDAARATLAALGAVTRGDRWALMNVVTGRATSLGELAELCVRACGGGTIVEQPPREFDVGWFRGDPRFAERQSGFRAQVSIEDGVAATRDELVRQSE